MSYRRRSSQGLEAIGFLCTIILGIIIVIIAAIGQVLMYLLEHPILFIPVILIVTLSGKMYIDHKDKKKQELAEIRAREQKKYEELILKIVDYIDSQYEVYLVDLARFGVSKEWIKNNWMVIAHLIPHAKLGREKITNPMRVKINRRGYIPKELREAIFKRDNYTCQRCGVKEAWNVQLQIDHIFPVSKGGSDDPENLQTLCANCNQIKSDSLLGINPKTQSIVCSKCGFTLYKGGKFCPNCGSQTK